MDARTLFDDAEIARGKRYHRPLYVALAANLFLGLGVLAMLAFTPVGDALHGLVHRLPWWLETPAFTALVLLASALVRLPLSFWRGYLHEQRWELSTQDARGWVTDWAKSFGVGAALSAAVVLGFIGLARASPAWPVLAAAAGAAFVLLLTFVAPVVLEPIFHRFEPLGDPELSRRIRSLAERAGVPVRDVLVADASRRTRRQNAYVSGLGATRRVVLFDTFVERSPPKEVDAVVAHELAHRRERHVAKFAMLGMLGAGVAMTVLWLLLAVDRLVAAAGADGAGDPRVVPLVLLALGLLEVVAMPLVAALSRRFERDADRIALELTGDARALESMFRRLAAANVADLEPPRLIRLLSTHPPIPDRIATVRG